MSTPGPCQALDIDTLPAGTAVSDLLALGLLALSLAFPWTLWNCLKLALISHGLQKPFFLSRFPQKQCEGNREMQRKHGNATTESRKRNGTSQCANFRTNRK